MRLQEMRLPDDPYEALLAAVVERAIRDAAAGDGEAQEFLQAIDIKGFIEEHGDGNDYHCDIAKGRCG